MKSLKSIILCGLGVALLSLASCSDVLDTEPYDQFTKDNYFTSETNVQLFANKTMTPLQVMAATVVTTTSTP